MFIEYTCISYFSLQNCVQKIHIKYDLLHHGDEILLNVGAGLYSIYAQQFQITAIATPSGGEHVTQDINKHLS